MPNCSCIKGHYEFKVESCESTRLFYTDLSEWMLEEPYVIPKNYKVQIIPPGKNTSIDKQVEALSTTVITAADLNLKRLEDGIYCFIISPTDKDSGGCGKEYTRSTAIFPNIQCCLNKAFSTEGEDKYADLKDVEKFLDFAKNESELGNTKAAAENYKIAKKKLDRLKCDCGC